jgi:hypothetical protein
MNPCHCMLPVVKMKVGAASIVRHVAGEAAPEGSGHAN